jgi:hypothetical protein
MSKETTLAMSIDLSRRPFENLETFFPPILTFSELLDHIIRRHNV